MGLISNGTTIFDAGAISAGAGSVSFIKKITASADSTISMVHGASNVVFDGTYKEYLITWNCLHPSSTSEPDFLINFRDGGTDYDAPKTTTSFRCLHNEADTQELFQYYNIDLANGTGGQLLGLDMDGDADSCISGYCRIFDPGNTTFVKHFIIELNLTHDSPRADHYHIAGHINTTAAIDGFQISRDAGNIASGDVCLYGIS